MTQGTNKTPTIKEKLELIKYFATSSTEVAEQIGKRAADLFNLEYSFEFEGQYYYEVNQNSIPTRQLALNLIDAFAKHQGGQDPEPYSFIGLHAIKMFSMQRPSDGKYPTSKGLKTLFEIEKLAGEIILDATQHLIAGTDNLLDQPKNQTTQKQSHQILIVSVDGNDEDNGGPSPSMRLYLDGHGLLTLNLDRDKGMDALEEAVNTFSQLAENLSFRLGVEIERTNTPQTIYGIDWNEYEAYLIDRGDLLRKDEINLSIEPQQHQVVVVDVHYDSALFLDGRLIMDTRDCEVDSQTVFELADQLSQLYCVKLNHIPSIKDHERLRWSEIQSKLFNEGVLMTEKASTTPLNELQSLVAKHYDGGKFAYADTLEKANAINDSLFGHLISEAKHANRDVSLGLFIYMTNDAEEKLRSLTGDLQEHQEQASPGVRP